MNKRNFLAMMVAAALVSTALAAGVEQSNTNARATSQTRTNETSSKQNAEADIGMLLSVGLGRVVGGAERHIRRSFYLGWTPAVVTEDRVGADIGDYMARVIAELQAAGTPEALWVANYASKLTTDADRWAFAQRETQAVGVQVAHSAHYPAFAEAKFNGRRRVDSAAFYTAWQPSLFYHAALANAVETSLGAAMQGMGAMPLAARRLKLVQLFFELPAGATEVQFDEQATGTLLNSQGGDAYQVQRNGKTYTANDRGIFVYSGGGVWFGGGVASGLKLAYTDSASGSKSNSKSRTKTDTTGRRSASNE